MKKNQYRSNNKKLSINLKRIFAAPVRFSKQ